MWTWVEGEAVIVEDEGIYIGDVDTTDGSFNLV